ncbi:hypothetical protein QJQ45_016014, partial [Haematococcus lacustris]
VMVSSAARAAARSNRPPPLPLPSPPLHSSFPCLFSLLPLTSSPSPPSLTPPSSSSPSPLPRPGGTWSCRQLEHGRCSMAWMIASKAVEQQQTRSQQVLYPPRTPYPVPYPGGVTRSITDPVAVRRDPVRICGRTL